MLWLDLPRALIMWQVVGRTVRRRLARQVLWNGNIEPPLWTLLTDRDPHRPLGLIHPPPTPPS
jgi:hypothetical protein